MRADGSARAGVDSPDKGAYDTPVTKVREARNAVGGFGLRTCAGTLVHRRVIDRR